MDDMFDQKTVAQSRRAPGPSMGGGRRTCVACRTGQAPRGGLRPGSQALHLRAIAARPKLEVLERIISDGIERGAEASTIARAVLDLVEGPKWKGRRHGDSGDSRNQTEES